MDDPVLVPPGQLAELMEAGAVIPIDTRDPASYQVGHIPGAVNAHDIFSYLASTTAQGLLELRNTFAAIFGAAGLGGAELGVCYEDSMGTVSGQSCRGYFFLKYLGYPRASVLHGGYRAWVDAGLPTSTDVTGPTPRRFPADESGAGLVIGTDAMLDAVGDPAVIKLEVRDSAEGMDATSPPCGAEFGPHEGRIPSARWFEWDRLMKPGKVGLVFKSKDEILAECRSVGITPDTPVILYCATGAGTSNTFIALKEAGIKDVRTYLGSWDKWSRHPSSPIGEGFPAPRSHGAVTP